MAAPTPSVPRGDGDTPPPAGGPPGGPGVLATAARHPVGVVWFGVVLFSTGPVIIAGSSISGIQFAFWRLWMGVLLLGGAMLLRRRSRPAPTPRVGWYWAVASGVAFALHQLAFMFALKETTVVDVTLMNTLAPIVVGVLAVPLFGERPGLRFRLWSVVAMAGAVGVIVAGSSGPQGDLGGMALAAVNVVFYAFYFVGSKLARPHIDTIPFLFANLVAAALCVSLFAVVTASALTPVGATDLGLCLAVALLPGAVGHFSVTWALRWVPANVPPVIMLSIPVLSGALAWLLLDQVVHGGQVLAGAVTLIAVLGAIRSPSAHRLGADEALVLAEES
jgi:drug/metabolite transporter (DMT)-like permease